MAVTTGGTEAPSGRSVAGRAVQRSRSRTNVRRERKVPTNRPAGHAFSSSGTPAPHHRPSSTKPRVSPTPKQPPYNALESPYANRGDFNKAVDTISKSQIEPELNQIGTEETGEQGLHNVREGDNVDTYNKLTQSANDNYAKAKESLAEVAARTRGATEAGQKNLQAALSNTGVAGLGGVPNPSAFMQEATGLGNESNEDLGKVQSGVVGQLSGNLAIPGVGLQQAQKEEGTRNAGQLAKLGLERRKVLATLPGIQAKTRAELSKQEGERETNKLQAQLAGKKLGFEERNAGEERNLKREENAQKRAESREALAAKAREFEAQLGIETGKLALQREELQAKIEEAKGGKAKAAAELAAKRWDNGLQILTSMTPAYDPKKEYDPTVVTDPTQVKKFQEEGKIPRAQVSPEHMYNALTRQALINAPEAFHMMLGTGNPAVERWARLHLERFERTRHNRRGGAYETKQPKK